MKKLLSALLLLFPLAIYAQVPAIDWQYTTGAPAFGSAASADLDKDGKLEIVFTTYTNDGRAHCLNAEDGSVSWIFDINGCGDVSPIIYDVDGDDTLDVIINGSCNPTLFCINGITGVQKWAIPSGGGDSPPTIYDIDMDQKPEILFGNFSGQLRIVNAEDGSFNKTMQLENDAIQTAPSIVDVNFDGFMDIIVANWGNDTGYEIYAVEYLSSNTLWRRTDTASSSFHAYHAGAVADLDGDDTLEYVIGRNNGSIIALNVEDGSELWQVTGLTNVISALTVADLDGDSVPEVIYSNNDYINFNDHIGILSGTDGTLEWSYPTSFSAFRGIALADLTGNGKLDMVSAHFLSRVRAVEPYVGLIWEINLGNHLPPGLPYHEADHGPIIADFDNDGNMEVFVVAGYGTYTPDSQNTGIAFALDGGTGGTCPDWLMFRQDVMRSGYLSPQEVEDGCDTTVVGMAEAGSAGLMVYPNPARDRLVIEGEGQEGGVLALLDLHGRTLWSGQPPAHNGRFYESIDLQQEGIVPGIYLVQFQSSSSRKTKKLVVQW